MELSLHSFICQEIIDNYDNYAFSQSWTKFDKILHCALLSNCKCFTYLTKTRANSTTYSRKPGNFNGTISFEIDIMKNSSPINLNLGQTWLFHICFGCFFCFDLLWRWAESPVSPAEKKCYFGFDMAKIVNFKLSGDEFFMMSTSKIMVPLQSPCFLQYVVEFAIVLTTFVKCLPGVLGVSKIHIFFTNESVLLLC